MIQKWIIAFFVILYTQDGTPELQLPSGKKAIVETRSFGV